jgi:hypothetical protein
MAPKYFDRSTLPLPSGSKKIYNVADIKKDLFKWNKEWEAAIALSTAADMFKQIYYTVDHSIFSQDDLEHYHSDLHIMLRCSKLAKTPITSSSLRAVNRFVLWSMIQQ